MKKDYDGPLYAEWWKVQKFKETSMTKKSKTIGSDTWEWKKLLKFVQHRATSSKHS